MRQLAFRPQRSRRLQLTTTDVLDVGEFVGVEGLPGGISRVGSQDHRSPPGELFRDFVDVDVVFVGRGEGARDGDELGEMC